MILVGMEGCSTCKIAKKFLSDIPYKQINSEELTPKENIEIKKALGKLNTSKMFPVVFNDSLDKMVDTKFILDNLDSKKIENELEKQ